MNLCTMHVAGVGTGLLDFLNHVCRPRTMKAPTQVYSGDAFHSPEAGHTDCVVFAHSLLFLGRTIVFIANYGSLVNNDWCKYSLLSFPQKCLTYMFKREVFACWGLRNPSVCSIEALIL